MRCPTPLGEESKESREQDQAAVRFPFRAVDELTGSDPQVQTRLLYK